MTESLLDPRVAARLERLVALARRRPAPAPRRRARPARGVEPGGRRDYAPGDDLRLLDWSAYARLERLLIRVTEAQPDPRLDLLLDTSRSMAHGDPPPGRRAALALAGVAACALARNARVQVWGGGGQRLELRRPGQLVELLRWLDRLPEGPPGGLSALAERLAATRRPRGAAALFTDALDPAGVAAAVRRLRAGGYAPWVVVAPPAAELPAADAAAAVEAGQVRLVDAETGAALDVPFAAASLAQAAAARAARQRALAAALDAQGLPLETLRPEAPFETIALGLLEGGAGEVSP